MALNDVYSVDLYTHAHDRQFVNTFAYRETTADTSGFPAAALAVEFGIKIVFPMKSIVSTEVNFGCIKVHKIVGDPGPTSVAYLVDEFGVTSGEALPGNIGLRLNLNGSKFGRSNRGALIIGGSPEDVIFNGKFSTFYLDGAVLTFITALTIPLDGDPPSTGTWTFGYMSRAPVITPGPLDPWPGDFIQPSSIGSSANPVVIRKRQTTHTGALGS